MSRWAVADSPPSKEYNIILHKRKGESDMQDTFTREEIVKKMNEEIDLYRAEKDITYLHKAINTVSVLTSLNLITNYEREEAFDRILAVSAGC